MVEYVFDKFISEGCGLGLQFCNALLEALWWLNQKARVAKVLHEATKCGLYPELLRKSKLVWSVDVHRMSVGGALTATSVWRNSSSSGSCCCSRRDGEKLDNTGVSCSKGSICVTEGCVAILRLSGVEQRPDNLPATSAKKNSISF